MINEEVIRGLPYLKELPTLERSVPLLPWYDHSLRRWRTWIVSDDTLHELLMDELVDGMYFSSAPVSSKRDHFLPFAEIICKHFYNNDTLYLMYQATESLIKACGCLEKYFILLNHSNKFQFSNTRALIQIELESIFGIHRSYYDILQKITAKVYKSYSKSRNELPKSFSRMAEKSSEELSLKYQLPRPLLEFYCEKKNLFITCRDIRDNIFHHGHSYNTIFHFEDGFAVPIDQKPWRHLSELVSLWPEDRVRENRLGSLLVIFAVLAEDIFKSMAWLGQAIISSFQEPPRPILEDHVYLRTSFAPHLHNLTWYECEQWLKPEQALPEMTEVVQQTNELRQ